MGRRYGRAGSFSNVDSSGDAREMVSYLDAITRIAAEGKRLSYEALHLQQGMRVLDAGCGTGDDVRALAEIVGRNGRACGVDFSQVMIDEAIARGVPENAEFVRASASELPYEDATFDAARSERVFQHLEHPDAAALELHRVVKPGGVVMLLDQDWETLAVAGSEKELTRKICRAFADHGANGWAGRYHRGLLTRAGFHDVVITPFPYMLPYPAAMSLILEPAVEYARSRDIVTAHEAAQFLADLQMAEEREEFVCAFTFFAATARR
jgi:ubiquinone/menaquinone biosynthesis C-methylase UbiE